MTTQELGAADVSLSAEEALFFNGWPRLLALYIALKGRLCAEYPDIRVKASKTQLSFYNRHMFAMVSLPLRRKADWPKEYLMVSFGLGYRLDSPRIAMSVQPQAGRFTHHVIVERAAEIDDELMGWIAEAYWFAQNK